MKLTVKSAINLRWTSPDNDRFDADVTFEEFDGVHTFTASADDVEAHGREIWENGVAGDYGEIAEYAAPAEPTPEEKRAAMPNLSARQLRLGLLHLGKLQDVPVAIDALPEPEKSQAQIEWDYATEFARLHPLIVQLIPILGLTDEQVDEVWGQFAQV